MTDRAAAPPISAVGPTVLARLGVDVWAPLTSTRATWSHLLPDAQNGGYFAAIAAAITRHEALPGDDASQLRWLAQHINIPAPQSAESWPHLNEAWGQAAEQAGSVPTGGLTTRGNQALLEALMRLPEYHSRLADALADAIRAELTP